MTTVSLGAAVVGRAPVAAAQTVTAAQAAPTGGGSAGAVEAFGNATSSGSMGGKPLSSPVVGMAATPDGGGYWEAASDGGIFTFGDAGFHGSMGGTPLNAPVVGMAATPDGGGYWEVASDGGIFTFGDAGFHGSMGGTPLNAPVVGMATDPATGGYWEVAADGGVFSFDAPFHGSMGGTPLNAPVVGMAATPDGGGYWEVASDGGIFTFGDAGFHGSMGGTPLNAPVVGMAATPTGTGYWEVASDGGVFTFGDAAFHGSMGGRTLAAPVVGMAAAPTGTGYWEVQGGSAAAADPPGCTNPNFSTSTTNGGHTYGSYYVFNDMWNPLSVTQTLYACNYDSWYVHVAMTSQGGAVQTYPNSQMIFQNHPALGTLGSMSSSFAESTTPTGSAYDYEYAYDIWVNGYGGPGHSELMIWNYDNGQPPEGTPEGTFAADGHTFDVYVTGTPAGGDYIAFVSTSNFTSGTYDLVGFLDHAIAAGWVEGGSSAQLWQVDYGLEICSTSGQPTTFAVTAFDVVPVYAP